MIKVAITDYTFDSLDVEAGILGPLGCDVVGRRCKTPAELIELVADADHVITQFAPVNADVVNAMQKARVIVRYGIGVDNVDLDAARAKGIPVCNVPDYCIDEVADHTLAFILALTRQVVANCVDVRGGQWRLPVPLSAMNTLRDLTVGVVGFGRIGREVCRRLVSFKCHVLVADPMVPPAEIEQVGCVPTALDHILPLCDVVTLHCPSTAETKGMINAKTIAKMKAGAILVNASRGNLVETPALVDALERGHLGGAALDVCDPEPIPPDSPLLKMDSVILAAHVASASAKAVQTLRESAADIVARAVRGEPLPNIVNGVGSKEKKGTFYFSCSAGTTEEGNLDTSAKKQNVPFSSQRMAREDLDAFCIDALLKTGMREDDAQIAADVLVTTDLMGVFTHGTKNLGKYIRRLRAGGLDPKATPRIVNEGPSWAVIDGHAALAMITARKAMETAIDKATTTGVAYAGARNSGHYGAAGYYALMAARSDMIGLSMSNDVPSMTAPGARGHILGTNPLAIGIPTGEGHPILLDIAMSTVAGSKVYQALSQGKPIPNTWIVDGDGLPTTDGSVYPHSASMLPMAGHKGYGLALLIETLSGLVSGACCRSEVGSWIFGDPSVPTGHGHAFLAINVGAIEPIDRFKDRVDGMIREIRESPKAKGSDRIYLPGEMEFERMDEAKAKGIALPQDVVDSLLAVAEELALDSAVLFAS